jgi:nuclear transport factor 2 (NTF2) superfamily protein
MARRHASINDLPIKPTNAKFHWPLGRRWQYPGLSDFRGCGAADYPE